MGQLTVSSQLWVWTLCLHPDTNAHPSSPGWVIRTCLLTGTSCHKVILPWWEVSVSVSSLRLLWRTCGSLQLGFPEPWWAVTMRKHYRTLPATWVPRNPEYQVQFAHPAYGGKPQFWLTHLGLANQMVDPNYMPNIYVWTDTQCKSQTTRFL